MFERELSLNGDIEWSELLNQSSIRDANLSDMTTEEFVELWQSNNFTSGLWFPSKPPSDFEAATFVEKSIIPSFHSDYPRFGKHRDIKWLFRGDDEYTPPEKTDYKMGILSLAIFLWAIFFVWAALLAYCKYTGKLGWLSGRVPKKPLSPSMKASRAAAGGEGEKSTFEDNEEPVNKNASITSAISTTEWREQVTKVETRVKWCRITVLVSGIIILVFSGLLIGVAFMSLDDTLRATKNGLPSIAALTGQMYNTSYQFLEAANKTTDARIAFFDTVGESCPALEMIEIGQTNISILDAFYFLNDTLNDTRAFLYPEIFNISDSLKNITNTLNDMHSTLDSVENWWVPVFASFVIVYDLIVLMFMVGVVLAWKHKQNRIFRDCSTKFVLPVFIFVLMILYLIATFGLMMTALSSDFCIDTPDNQILRIIGAPFPFNNVIEWFITGCHDEDYPFWFFGAIQLIFLFGKAMRIFMGAVSNVDPDEINVFCGEDASLLVSAAEFLELQIINLGQLLIEVAQELRCPDINTIYTHMAYTTLCTYAVQGLMELFIFLIIVAFFSMVIVTLRIAWFEIESEQDEMEEMKNLEEPSEIESSNELLGNDFDENASAEYEDEGIDHDGSHKTDPDRT